MLTSPPCCAWVLQSCQHLAEVCACAPAPALYISFAHGIITASFCQEAHLVEHYALEAWLAEQQSTVCAFQSAAGQHSQCRRRQQRRRGSLVAPAAPAGSRR